MTVVHRPSLVRALALGLVLAAAGCHPGERTTTTNVDGVRIPAAVLDGLGPDLDHRGWLELHYGEPTRVEARPDGESLVWVRTIHTQEHFPDPHESLTTIESHVLLGHDGRILRGWHEATDERID